MKEAQHLPLSALLSQTLVAFTIELDNEFERRMRASGDDGGGLSLVLWLWLFRFVAEKKMTVAALTTRTLDSPDRIKFVLGCLERWRFIKFTPPPGKIVKTKLHRQSGKLLRDGWGSGRGILDDWTVQLRERGQLAATIWPPLPEEIEERWRERFGPGIIAALRESLHATAHSNDFPPILALMLSKALVWFQLEFDQRSKVGIALSANLLRVVTNEGVRESDIPRLTGSSPERSALGWQTKPFVVKRGNLVTLTPLGLKARQKYFRLAAEIEGQWETGTELRQALEKVLTHPKFVLGLTPPPGVVRSGYVAPALGRKAVAPAARKRARDVVKQTEMFLADPTTLPHFPLWDMNRGFGP